MPALTQTQVRELCLKVGFTAAEAKIAAAIAMVESPLSMGGKSYSNGDAVGDQALATDHWGYSYGHFQVRSVRSETNDGTSRDASRLGDSEFNCRSALAVYKAQGWRAWSTYNGGQYKAYLQDVFPPPPGVYIVVGGDSLSRIATKLGNKFSWPDLARVNGLHSPYRIFIGQALVLPWFTYTVREGDTLAVIVALYAHGVSVADVAAFNSLADPNKITPGQLILIPRETYLG